MPTPAEWRDFVRNGVQSPRAEIAYVRAQNWRRRRDEAHARQRYLVIYEDFKTGETRAFGWSSSPNGGAAMYLAKLCRFVLNPRVVGG